MTSINPTALERDGASPGPRSSDARDAAASKAAPPATAAAGAAAAGSRVGWGRIVEQHRAFYARPAIVPRPRVTSGGSQPVARPTADPTRARAEGPARDA